MTGSLEVCGNGTALLDRAEELYPPGAKADGKTELRDAGTGVIAGLVVRPGPSRQKKDDFSGEFDCAVRTVRWSCARREERTEGSRREYGGSCRLRRINGEKSY